MSASGYDWWEVSEAFASADPDVKDVVRDLVRPGGVKVQWSDMTKARQTAIVVVLGLKFPKD